jgi:hypothetical protein
LTPAQRLKQIEILLSTAAKNLNQHTEAIKRLDEQHTEAIKRLENQHVEAVNRIDEQLAQINVQMLRLTEMFMELAAIARQNEQENRRIWEYLLSQRHNGHSGS